MNLIAEKDPSITVVGDEDQCIYSFRGANYYNIADFRKRYESHRNYAEIRWWKTALHSGNTLTLPTPPSATTLTDTQKPEMPP